MNTRVLRRRFNNGVGEPSVILGGLNNTVRSITVNGEQVLKSDGRCEYKFDGPQNTVTIVASTNDYYSHEWDIEGACSSYDVQGSKSSQTITLNNVFGVVKLIHVSYIK